MKIRMNFGILKTVIIAVVFAGVLAVVALDIAILAGANGFDINSPAVPAVSMVAALLVGIACALLLLNSYYGFKQEYFAIMLGFFADKVAYGDVIMLKQDIETSELYLIVNDKSKSAVKSQIALKVNVSPAKSAAFLAEMRVHIPDVTVEMFSKPKKKNKDK
ncbi:MAG: hypothetical protein NC037_03755 [Bacteroides sp.]|nr:hypothetical protein [Bacillota bacterium]MCM1394223.1 hypothetical protein [[Eubacterium] siraeum]MCM1455625.1 hypothetical protein [Bacteroides sp.]